jgi:hypothetical protein
MLTREQLRKNLTDTLADDASVFISALAEILYTQPILGPCTLQFALRTNYLSDCAITVAVTINPTQQRTITPASRLLP